jgi:hypothetical protein
MQCVLYPVACSRHYPPLPSSLSTSCCQLLPRLPHPWPTSYFTRPLCSPLQLSVAAATLQLLPSPHSTSRRCQPVSPAYPQVRALPATGVLPPPPHVSAVAAVRSSYPRYPVPGTFYVSAARGSCPTYLILDTLYVTATAALVAAIALTQQQPPPTTSLRRYIHHSLSTKTPLPPPLWETSRTFDLSLHPTGNLRHSTLITFYKKLMI